MTDANQDFVRKTAKLARLDLSSDEEARLAGEFEAILGYFEVLSELDVEGVEPMTGATDVEDVLRDDEPRPSLSPDEVLRNAPEREGDFYRVPKTIGGDS